VLLRGWKIKLVGHSETSILFYQATRRRIPEGSDLTKLYCVGECHIWVYSGTLLRVSVLISLGLLYAVLISEVCL